ncbi:phosphonate C-P lyase system protein PhnG [Microvirga sp. VF16]|uniref:phosphonate C-P lyase system protein PhnG n=1 Tax=Microvirga sp. VF16 TaxID=2807101 RepID=UPI00193DB773|nr:phosphonate C-P lyase system protein PhnG [Microvirga sp. VF16]QRM33673.1 phosphonate C-P lyase system protein PhnG [Microvirga sp. VF16]
MHSYDEARKRRLDALSCGDPTHLAERYATLEPSAPAATPIRGPEIGMVMLRGRAGGGGAVFNLGEATVTRATVKLATGEVGHAIVLGRHLQKARIVAHLDALSQIPDWVQVIETDFVAPALAEQEAARTRQAEETQATRVDFFTMVRGED